MKAVVLDVDVEKERISLGMKQLERGGVAKGGAAARRGGGGVNKNETVTVTVLEVRDGGLDVQVGDDGVTGFIKRTDLGRDRDEQRPERFQVGQKFDAMVIGFDRSKKPNFSIKALQIAEEKQAVAQYGSSDSGASPRRHPGRGPQAEEELISAAAGAFAGARPPSAALRSSLLNCSDFSRTPRVDFCQYRCDCRARACRVGARDMGRRFR